MDNTSLNSTCLPFPPDLPRPLDGIQGSTSGVDVVVGVDVDADAFLERSRCTKGEGAADIDCMPDVVGEERFEVLRLISISAKYFYDINKLTLMIWDLP